MILLPPTSILFPYTTLFRSRNFSEQELEELSQSIGEHGVLQPIMLRRSNEVGRYVIVMGARRYRADRKSTRLNSSHPSISYAVFCLKKKILVLAFIAWSIGG